SYQNVGTAALTGVTVTESYDSNVSFVSAVPPPDIGDNMWSIGTLGSNASGTITITTDVALGISAGTVLHNDAFIADDGGHSASASTDTIAAAACGDGTVTPPDEQCDDGAANGTDDSCCTISCTLKSGGTSCTDDGNPCTLDQCNGSQS